MSGYLPPPHPAGPSRRLLLAWAAALPVAALAPAGALAAPMSPGSRIIDGHWQVYDLPATRIPHGLAPSASDGPPHDAARAPDGRLWFTDWAKARIGALSPITGTVAAYAMPLGRRAGPSALAIDGAGRVYVGEMIANRISRFDPAAGRFDTSWELPLPRARIRRLAIDDKGCIWFADAAKGKLARLS